MINIKNTNVDVKANGLKVLVYGGPGAGKTRLIQTIEGKPLILSAESGLLSIKDSNIDYIEINKFDDLRESFAFISLSDEASKYDWICLDSLSEIAEICLDDELKINKDGRKAYLEMQIKLINLTKSFRDLKKNVYISAKMSQEKDDFAGMMMYAPMFPGSKLAAQIPYLLDEVYYLNKHLDEEGKIVTYFLTTQDKNYKAKNRCGKLELYEEANLTYIYNKIFGAESLENNLE